MSDTSGSLTENLIDVITAVGGARPQSKGLQELYQALAIALAAFTPEVGVQSVVAGTNVTVNDTDPQNPVVSSTGGSGGGTVDSVVAGTGIAVDSTDPANPVVSATGSGGGGAFAHYSGVQGVNWAGQGFAIENEFSFPWTGEAASGISQWSTLISSPAITFPAGSLFSQVGEWALTLPATPPSNYDLQVSYTITNEDGTQAITLTGSGVVTTAETTTGFDTTDSIITWELVAVAGSDLSYDSSTGFVSSAAGGVYTVAIFIAGFYE